MKTVKLSESIMDKLGKGGEAFGRVYTYRLFGRVGVDGKRWFVYRWRTYHLASDNGYQFTTFDYAMQNGLLEVVLVNGLRLLKSPILRDTYPRFQLKASNLSDVYKTRKGYFYMSVNGHEVRWPEYTNFIRALMVGEMEWFITSEWHKVHAEFEV